LRGGANAGLLMRGKNIGHALRWRRQIFGQQPTLRTCFKMPEWWFPEALAAGLRHASLSTSTPAASAVGSLFKTRSWATIMFALRNWGGGYFGG